MKITYQERIGEDGEPVSVPVVPPDATADEIEAVVAAEGAAVLTDEQAAAETRRRSPARACGSRRRAR